LNDGVLIFAAIILLSQFEPTADVENSIALVRKICYLSKSLFKVIKSSAYLLASMFIAVITFACMYAVYSDDHLV